MFNLLVKKDSYTLRIIILRNNCIGIFNLICLNQGSSTSFCFYFKKSEKNEVAYWEIYRENEQL